MFETNPRRAGASIGLRRVMCIDQTAVAILIATEIEQSWERRPLLAILPQNRVRLVLLFPVVTRPDKICGPWAGPWCVRV